MTCITRFICYLQVPLEYSSVTLQTVLRRKRCSLLEGMHCLWPCLFVVEQLHLALIIDLRQGVQ
jgi:hypothetical protein